MAEKKGKLVICDLCGYSEFVAHTSTSNHDGGFTQVEHYEALSDGWQYSNDLGVKLCPNCGAAWKKCKEDYLYRYKAQIVKEE